MKIDFHVHTNISPCSRMSLEDAVREALGKGLSGIAVCNHDKSFLTDDIPSDLESKFNIKINPDSPCENAFYLIPGIEISISGGHFLGLFIKRPVISLEYYVDGIIDAGGLVVAAHPFEQETDFHKKREILEYYLVDTDLIECYSGRANYKNKKACDMAKTFANEYKMPKCAGSDAHFVEEIGNAWVEFDDKIVGLDNIKEALINGECSFFSKDAKRITVAKSQIVKNKFNFKAYLFWCYSYIRDIGDTICRKLHS